jgi:hypothetical protein
MIGDCTMGAGREYQFLLAKPDADKVQGNGQLESRNLVGW